MSLLVLQVSAQVRQDSCCLAKKDLIDAWQRDNKGVGNGIEQNIRFFADGSFFLALANEGEDARGIVSLQGKYRLEKTCCTLLSRLTRSSKVVKSYCSTTG